MERGSCKGIVLGVVLLVATATVAAAKPKNGPTIKKKLGCAYMLNATANVVSKIQWPQSAYIVLSGKLPPEWGDSISGTVAPNGQYDSPVGILEYWYGLAGPPNPDPVATLGMTRASAVDIIYTTCNKDKKITAFDFVVTFNNGTNDLFNLDIAGALKFSTKSKRICGYDVYVKRQGFALDFQNAGPKEPQFAQICGGIQFACTGNNTQFDSVASCITFMAGIPFGSWDYADQNNFICRNLHLQLALVDPVTHCPHVGPSGGMKCVNHPYEGMFAAQKKNLSCN